MLADKSRMLTGRASKKVENDMAELGQIVMTRRMEGLKQGNLGTVGPGK